ncbi:SIS domain-containing protein [Aquamicrobium segne]|uniref:SIS domain-containing protein n=1 Tax=Aquamicrobium segne TaxID=469547 RepID=A0ABW0H390_9HYPH
MMAVKTYMRTEIEEIPQAVARFLDQSDQSLSNIGQDLRRRSPSFIATVARGSSAHAATYLNYALELTTGLAVAPIGPSIASIYGTRLRLKNAACFIVSQSGKSPDIIALANNAATQGAVTVALTNAASSPLAAICDYPIDIMAGPELSVAATKTFVNSIVAGLALMAYATRNKALLGALKNLPPQLEQALSCDWSALSSAFEDQNSLYILGRGPSSAMANEAALKLKETCSIHAEAYSAAEVMHGPMALVGPGFPILALAARDAAEPSLTQIADAMREKQAAVFATSDRVTRAARLPFVTTDHPLPLIVSFYAFVEAFARHKGHNPDQPRHLNKVTETV